MHLRKILYVSSHSEEEIRFLSLSEYIPGAIFYWLLLLFKGKAALPQGKSGVCLTKFPCQGSVGLSPAMLLLFVACPSVRDT